MVTSIKTFFRRYPKTILVMSCLGVLTVIGVLWPIVIEMLMYIALGAAMLTLLIVAIRCLVDEL